MRLSLTPRQKCAAKFLGAGLLGNMPNRPRRTETHRTHCHDHLSSFPAWGGEKQARTSHAMGWEPGCCCCGWGLRPGPGPCCRASTCAMYAVTCMDGMEQACFSRPCRCWKIAGKWLPPMYWAAGAGPANLLTWSMGRSGARAHPYQPHIHPHSTFQPCIPTVTPFQPTVLKARTAPAAGAATRRPAPWRRAGWRGRTAAC